jgi:hypothetical protein
MSESCIDPQQLEQFATVLQTELKERERFKWTPRPYQKTAWDYLQNGGKRAYLVWHRRAGKDDVCLRHTFRASQ